MSDDTNNGVHQRSEHPIYAELHDSDDFAELRKRYRSFAIPFTVAFPGPVPALRGDVELGR
ncbi:DUF485 domain-containing protein [Nocardioides sp. B-3]|uniref:DUF485 domain-containing protein n=1 Tax=Nocardioides sp. B-3 TaxID=2895565 RepID=UPI002152541D|nr:DUF485 domain-containing protein [Nocardioides sp. B-3]UUZ60865.1 DUF485 domain-containing protein [Nocardioides sp. B-3]